MTAVFRLLAGICALLLTLGPARAEETVTVFAAASLRGALEAAVEGFPARVVVSYGGSGVLARQVTQGAPADLVFLANAVWMDWLEERGALVPDTRRDLLGNALVLVAPAGAPALDAVTPAALVARLDGGRLAIGNTLGVPAGIYGREWLTTAGLWPELRPHLAETENVRAALALVARGEAPLGVVYASDAEAEPGVRVVHAVDPALHAPIVYPAALVAGRGGPVARALLAHLSEPPAQAAFAAQGFRPLGATP
ncbi:molybdate ABC transporter substrate-binding protein [Roseovarius aestuariivivens]|uniref:molybdate ABC transporter substrate-binding protein n=1 Tax=Roseovarius aestuariivivens TaxID=1888910 RepID=UPI001081C10B|nr:molybdate ABC transporter substrate-binding protein [Roseovarius aestuariivivens]